VWNEAEEDNCFCVLLPGDCASHGFEYSLAGSVYKRCMLCQMQDLNATPQIEGPKFQLFLHLQSSWLLKLAADTYIVGDSLCSGIILFSVCILLE